MKIKKKEYYIELSKFKARLDEFSVSTNYTHAIEAYFESLDDWSVFYTLEELKEWFVSKRKSPSMSVREVPIKQLDGWIVDKQTGNISHKSKDFFLIRGLRITTEDRESEGGWSQPTVEQIGYDGGILGVIRKRFDGIPHYLCEAKSEPGNYGIVQLSTTLQATFANLNQKHNGRRPYFAEYFDESPPGVKVLFDAWLAEDGGRLYNKRNRGVLIELPESHNISLPSDNFCWVSLFQIKELLKEDAWVSPHLRSVLSHV